MFETAVSLKPDYAEAHFNLGVVLKVSGRPNLAVESYKKAIELLPNYFGAHNNYLFLCLIYKSLPICENLVM